MLNQMTRLRNLELKISYCGRGYYGWQIQPEVPTIQKIVQDILRRTLRDATLKVGGASRTDAGVHAHDQRVGFQTRKPIPLEGLKRTLNRQLPMDIRVGHVCERSPSFSVRYSSKGKHYAYFWSHGAVNPFVSGYATPSLRPLNWQVMDAMCGQLLGTQCFRAFQSSQDERDFSETTIFTARVRQLGNLICFEVVGHSFLYHMVRNMARSLAQVGTGVWSSDRWTRYFQTGDRKKMCMTAPAAGLHLAKVFYGDDELSFSPDFESFKHWLAKGISISTEWPHPSLDPS